MKCQKMKESTKDPLIHFPFYINQYQGLLSGYSFSEKGAFISLLCVYLSEDGIIPEDKSRLFRMAGAFEEEEKKALDSVFSEVVRIGSEILETQRGKRKKCREAARIGGLSRVANAQANAKQTLKRKSSNTETETETETDIKERNKNILYHPLAEGLVFILEEKLNKTLPKKIVESWASEIRKLVEIDLKNRTNPLDDVKKAIQTIGDNFGNKYFPIIQSGSSLRDKFSKIEGYIQRDITNRSESSINKIMNIKLS